MGSPYIYIYIYIYFPIVPKLHFLFTYLKENKYLKQQQHKHIVRFLSFPFVNLSILPYLFYYNYMYYVFFVCLIVITNILLYNRKIVPIMTPITDTARMIPIILAPPRPGLLLSASGSVGTNAGFIPNISGEYSEGGQGISDVEV
mmetsp:Transcript_8335/g.8168  ORF Transcript_8335/g.8168 Transcript_8335/m.8168 type:complete len:145 (+) Transcript_8335:264-698(+)